MSTYYVIVQLEKTNYITKIDSTSKISAEQTIISLDYEFYVITRCRAYDVYEVRCITTNFVDFFNGVISSEPVSFNELKNIIIKIRAEIMNESEDLTQ